MPFQPTKPGSSYKTALSGDIHPDEAKVVLTGAQKLY